MIEIAEVGRILRTIGMRIDRFKDGLYFVETDRGGFISGPGSLDDTLDEAIQTLKRAIDGIEIERKKCS